MSTLPLFPTIGIPELLIILVIVLIFFGAGKLPQIGKALGEGIKGFRDGTRAEDEKGKAGQIEAEADDDPDQRIRTKQRPDNHRDTR
ncbi:MAG: twin-arginine translocase TatA/TatE family subunit [Pseudomonadota bacterium]